MQFRRWEDFDTRAVERLYTEVFTASEGVSEGKVIGALALRLMREVSANDLCGFVATDAEDVVGAIFFSRLRFATPVEAFLLSPVAVATAYHGKGVGQGLIRFGLDALREWGVHLVCTYGDPKFYGRVGFHAVDTETIPAPFALTQPEGWLCQWLNEASLPSVAGPSRCVPPFDNPDYW
ncbi:GNAT family N-acetyltransferase [Algiphilus sp.]|uniref:GNAT family N-acetyltransferase n=1 Tax=Algiphilus sp. TaxID=1872431 RepID=UPI003B530093